MESCDYTDAATITSCNRPKGTVLHVHSYMRPKKHLLFRSLLLQIANCKLQIAAFTPLATVENSAGIAHWAYDADDTCTHYLHSAMPPCTCLDTKQ